MPLTEAEQKTLIITQVGKTGDAAFAAMVDSLWEFYEGLGQVSHPHLRFYYVKREAILTLLTQLKAPFDFKEADVSVSRTQQVKYYTDLLQVLTKQIEVLEGRLIAGQGPKTGQITREAPIVREDRPDTWEAHDRAYRGDPWRRTGKA